MAWCRCPPTSVDIALSCVCVCFPLSICCINNLPPLRYLHHLSTQYLLVHSIVHAVWTVALSPVCTATSHLPTYLPNQGTYLPLDCLHLQSAIPTHLTLSAAWLRLVPPRHKPANLPIHLAGRFVAGTYRLALRPASWRLTPSYDTWPVSLACEALPYQRRAPEDRQTSCLRLLEGT